MSIPKFVNETPIQTKEEIIKLLRGRPNQNTQRFLQLKGDIAWVEVDIYSREGHHLSTQCSLVDTIIAQELVEEGIVVTVNHPPDFGGNRLELK